MSKEFIWTPDYMKKKAAQVGFDIDEAKFIILKVEHYLHSKNTGLDFKKVFEVLKILKKLPIRNNIQNDLNKVYDIINKRSSRFKFSEKQIQKFIRDGWMCPDCLTFYKGHKRVMGGGRVASFTTLATDERVCPKCGEMPKFEYVRLKGIK